MAQITDEFFYTQVVKIQPRDKNWRGKRRIITQNSDGYLSPTFHFLSSVQCALKSQVVATIKYATQLEVSSNIHTFGLCHVRK